MPPPLPSISAHKLCPQKLKHNCCAEGAARHEDIVNENVRLYVGAYAECYIYL